MEEQTPNMDGIDINNYLMIALKGFKQSAIIQSRSFNIQHIVSREQLAMTNIDIEALVKSRMIDTIGRDILEKFYNHFKIEDVPEGKKISLSLMAMALPELKHIVEFCIQQMPQSAIEEIRK